MRDSWVGKPAHEFFGGGACSSLNPNRRRVLRASALRIETQTQDPVPELLRIAAPAAAFDHVRLSERPKHGTIARRIPLPSA
jgi:hypothetical protein